MKSSGRSKILKQQIPVNDAHCHFFSERFFGRLGSQLEPSLNSRQVADRLGWDWPGADEDLAGRWLKELDAHKVRRCALMASLPGDESSVETAVATRPDRLVGMFMVDPTQPGADGSVRDALGRGRLQVPCLFPAMHGYRLDGDEALRVFEAASQGRARAVFVHCGQLSVGVRKKLGLPSRFDIRLGNPLDLHRALSAFPDLPVIIPHFGAGMFRESLMLADMHGNVVLDTSSSNSWVKFHPGLSLQQVFSRAIDVMGAGRLLFGSDSSFFPRGWQDPIRREQCQLLKGLALTPGEEGAIFRENFERIFPVPGTARKSGR